MDGAREGAPLMWDFRKVRISFLLFWFSTRGAVISVQLGFCREKKVSIALIVSLDLVVSPWLDHDVSLNSVQSGLGGPSVSRRGVQGRTD